jgi:dienelactone hydrolase
MKHLLAVITLWLGSCLTALAWAQHLDPQMGWSWKKAEFETLDEDRAKLNLHYKLQSTKAAHAVLIGHDNGGISTNEKTYADFMYAQGFHVFLLDRIVGRKRVARPLEIFLIADTFAAARYIRQSFQGSIDGERLSYASFSGDGGFGGLMALEPKARRAFDPVAPDQFRFYRVAAMYPHCLHVKDGGPDTPALIIGAELDGSDPKVCQKAYEKFPQVRVDIYPGAFHGFDQSGLRQKTWIAKPVIMPGTCEWQIDFDQRRQAQGHRFFLLTAPGGAKQDTREFSQYNQGCITNQAGYFSEYRDDLTRKAFQATVDFFRQ